MGCVLCGANYGGSWTCPKCEEVLNKPGGRRGLTDRPEDRIPMPPEPPPGEWGYTYKKRSP